MLPSFDCSNTGTNANSNYFLYTFMTNVIKLRKGLDINLKGKAAEQKFPSKAAAQYALVPDDFVGMTPNCLLYTSDAADE